MINEKRRRGAIAALRAAELPPEAVAHVVAETITEISAVMEERANAVERFIT